MRLSKDKSSVIRFEVATILFDVKNQASKKLLFQLAKDRDSLVRAEAYTSLSGFKFADVEEFLRKAIEREKDELACSYAITSWGEVALKLFDEHDEDINYVNKLLRTHKIMVSERCRLECYYALYGFGDKKMLKKIMKFLTRYSKNSPTSLGGEMNCKKIRENTCSNVPDVVQYNQSNKRKD